MKSQHVLCALPLCLCCLWENCCDWSYGQKLRWWLESVSARGTACGRQLHHWMLQFLYKQGPEFSLWPILPALQLLCVSRLPNQDSMVNKIKCKSPKVNHIYSNIWGFSLHFPVFCSLVQSMGKTHQCLSHRHIVLRSLLWSLSVGYVKCTLIPVGYHLSL